MTISRTISDTLRTQWIVSMAIFLPTAQLAAQEAKQSEHQSQYDDEQAEDSSDEEAKDANIRPTNGNRADREDPAPTEGSKPRIPKVNMKFWYYFPAQDDGVFPFQHENARSFVERSLAPAVLECAAGFGRWPLSVALFEVRSRGVEPATHFVATVRGGTSLSLACLRREIPRAFQLSNPRDVEGAPLVTVYFAPAPSGELGDAEPSTPSWVPASCRGVRPSQVCDGRLRVGMKVDDFLREAGLLFADATIIAKVDPYAEWERRLRKSGVRAHSENETGFALDQRVHAAVLRGKAPMLRAGIEYGRVAWFTLYDSAFVAERNVRPGMAFDTYVGGAGGAISVLDRRSNGAQLGPDMAARQYMGDVAVLLSDSCTIEEGSGLWTPVRALFIDTVDPTFAEKVQEENSAREASARAEVERELRASEKVVQQGRTKNAEQFAGNVAACEAIIARLSVAFRREQQAGISGNLRAFQSANAVRVRESVQLRQTQSRISSAIEFVRETLSTAAADAMLRRGARCLNVR